MSEIILYTTHCPHALFWVGPVIESGFYYDVDLGDDVVKEEDLAKIEELGFLAAPILKVDDKYMIFKEACDWIKNIETGEC